MSDDSSKSVAPASTRALAWGPLSAIIMTLVAFLVGAFISSFLISLYPVLRHWSHTQSTDWLQHNVSAQFFYVLLSEVITVFILWRFLHRRRAKPRDIGFSKPSFEDIGYTLIGFAIYFVLYVVVVAVVGNAVDLDVKQHQDVGFSAGDVVGSLPLIMTFVSLVVLPPLVEELIFRGFLFSGLRTKFNLVGATLITSLLFAAPHLLESGDSKLLWIAGVDTFVLSCVLCYLRNKTGRLWAGIGVHALKNGQAFLYLFILHVH